MVVVHAQLVKATEDKIIALDSHKLLACTGDVGDASTFAKFLQKNMKLYSLRNGGVLARITMNNV